jgi:tripartite-type tricarboxylate transporter receptor subunit TctC
MKSAHVLMAVIIWALLAGAALAQSAVEYPFKPVRVLVPYAPGGMTDIVARQIGAKLYEGWKQPVIIDNRAGAGGNLALEAVARASGDGYTLLLGNVTTNAINPHVYAGVMRFNPLKELTPVIICCEVPQTIIASISFPPRTVRELVDLAKANPGKVTYGTPGVGSSPHLDVLKLIRATGIEMVHVPFKGGAAPILTSLGGGEIQWTLMNLSLAYSFSKAGRVRVLAVAMENRAPELPDVPTMAESGFPGIGSPQWQAVFAPAATPRTIVAKLHAAIQQVIQRPDLKDFFARNFLTIIPNNSPQAAAAYVNADSERWAKIVKENNISLTE